MTEEIDGSAMVAELQKQVAWYAVRCAELAGLGAAQKARAEKAEAELQKLKPPEHE